MAIKNTAGSKVFKGTINYDNLRLDHQGQLKKLNDVLIETKFTVEGLTSVLNDVVAEISAGKTVYVIKVPNKKSKSISIRRNLQKLKISFEENIEYKEYIKSLVFVITIVEDYLSSNIIRILRAYPRKLLISSKGNKSDNSSSHSVDMRDLLDAGSLETIVAQRAEQRTRDAMYASPAQYIKYFSSVTGINITATVWASYAEIKATRDLYVHGDGTVNKIYIDKTGTGSRYSLGQKAVVDAAYFDTAASCLKSLMSEIYVGLRSEFCDSAELGRIFNQDHL